ncbi:MAG: hotdog domain-containing protein [Desulfobacterales bacterium]
MEIYHPKKISELLCGKALETKQGFSRVELKTLPEMAADEKGLVHGGFVFGLADYAAMIAVNHPNVVLGGANVKFLKPVKVGESVTAEARVTEQKGKKHLVTVTAAAGEIRVFEGEFTCFVLDKHVLDA